MKRRTKRIVALLLLLNLIASAGLIPARAAGLGSSINKYSTMAQIESLPEFRDHKQVFEMAGGVLGTAIDRIPIHVMCQVNTGWNEDSIVEGIQYLSDTAKRQETFFQVYSQAEISQDSDRSNAILTAFPTGKRSKFVVIVPGGGYTGVASIQEGFPMAKKLNELGYSAFVVTYRCGGGSHKAPVPQEDLSHAVRFILGNADQFNIDPEGYAIMGFSAGGHLAASFGTESLGWKYYGLPKPGTMILGYPVITMGQNTHTGSRDNLLGRNASEDSALIDKWSIQKQVTSNYPATYLWQCDEDNTVPVQNSRLMDEALLRNHVPVQYQLYHSNVHGWGVGKGTIAEGWVEKAMAFWQNHVA